MKRPLYLLLLALLTACTLQSEPAPRTPSLTLDASVREGVAPARGHLLHHGKPRGEPLRLDASGTSFG